MEIGEKSERCWRIEGYEGTQKVFEKMLPLGMLSESEMASLLQRLAAASLAPDEIVRASLRSNAEEYISHLECRREGSPPALRFNMSVDGAGRLYTASVWSAAELQREASSA